MQGEVLIKGQVRKGLLSDDPELAQQLKVGMVFQNGALFDSLTVGENVGFMLYEHTQLPEERVKVSCQKLLSCALSVIQGGALANMSQGCLRPASWVYPGQWLLSM